MMRQIYLPNKRQQSGLTLIELVVAIAICVIPILGAGVLLAGSSRTWQQIYDDAHSPARQDAFAIMASIQRIGRQANVLNYNVYRIHGNAFLKATPSQGQIIAAGQAVEFRYWQENFDPQNADSEVLELDNTGTHYALYYLDGQQLRVDFGEVVSGIGGVHNNQRNTSNIIESRVLSEHVDIGRNINIFNHIMTAGQGSGCVNTDITLTDDDGVTVNVKFSTLIRSAWPR